MYGVMFFNVWCRDVFLMYDVVMYGFVVFFNVRCRDVFYVWCRDVF